MRAFLTLLAALLVIPLAPALGGSPGLEGAWGSPFPLPVQGEYATVLPTGEVLLFEFGSDATLWDPVTGAIVPVPLDAAINCVGIVLLPDGRVLVMGGHADAAWLGTPASYVFDPWSREWSRVADLEIGRYYPGAVQLADGRVLVVSGNGPDGDDASTPEVFDGAVWTLLPSATQRFEFYPRMHVLPGGDVVTAGQEARSYRLDVDTMAWTPGPVSVNGMRWGGASALLPDLQTVLVFGGGSLGASSEGGLTGPFRDDASTIADSLAHGRAPATTSAQRLDTVANEWRDAASLTLARRDGQAVLLPTGDVLAVGGGYGFEPVPAWAEHALSPEVYSVENDAWTLLAPASRHRGYHSSAVLLPDGRILVSGGDFETGVASVPGGSVTGEVFHPPYLFGGPRPSILHVESEGTLGEVLALRVEGDVDALALVRLSTVTHSLNTDQRVIPLAFARAGAEALIARLPDDAGAAPPGWYMLFALEDGVPSTAKMIHVRA